MPSAQNKAKLESCLLMIKNMGNHRQVWMEVVSVPSHVTTWACVFIPWISLLSLCGIVAFGQYRWPLTCDLCQLDVETGGLFVPLWLEIGILDHKVWGSPTPTPTQQTGHGWRLQRHMFFRSGTWLLGCLGYLVANARTPKVPGYQAECESHVKPMPNIEGRWFRKYKHFTASISSNLWEYRCTAIPLGWNIMSFKWKLDENLINMSR